MYMKTPKIFNRPMKKVKEYPKFVLFVDEKTGIRECFQYFDLTHEIKYVEGLQKIFKYDENGKLTMVNDKKEVLPYTPKSVAKKKQYKVSSDKRLDNLINDIFSNLV